MDDHQQDCAGLNYTCTCGYDAERDAEIERLRILTWELANEVKNINAQYGAPSGVAQEWWDEVLEKARVALGGDIKPWHPKYDKGKTDG